MTFSIFFFQRYSLERQETKLCYCQTVGSPSVIKGLSGKIRRQPFAIETVAKKAGIYYRKIMSASTFKAKIMDPTQIEHSPKHLD